MFGYLSAFRSEADMDPGVAPSASVVNDPNRTSRSFPSVAAVRISSGADGLPLIKEHHWEALMAQTGVERSDGGVYGSAVSAAAGWQRGAAGRADLRPITDRMLGRAGIRPGHRVLDVAAGTGEQTLMAARRVGPDGFVLATCIADRMLAYLDEAARNEGLTNVHTRLVDARLLELERDSFDAAICRLALMLIPERHKALTAIHRALKAGAR